MAEQPSGYDFEVAGEKVNEYECPICLMLLREAVELPCDHLMCEACLSYYEETELARNPNAQFRCIIDRKIYQRNQKKNFGSMHKIITNSIRVKCKQADCNWTGTISNYQDHHHNVCGLLLIKCPNDECQFSAIRKRMQQHVCEYRMIECDYCGMELKYKLMNDHHQNDCQHFPIVCPNNGCDEIIQRNLMEVHHQNDCLFLEIDCPFNKLGCIEKMLRSNLDDHYKRSNTQHTMFLLNQFKVSNEKHEMEIQHLKGIVEALNEKVEQQNKEVEETNKKVEELNEKIENQNETIETQRDQIMKLENEMNQEVEETNRKVEELNEKIENQNETIETQRDQITKLENEMNQQKELLSNKIEIDVKNLNLFAEQASKLLTSVASFEGRCKNKYVGFFIDDEKKYKTNDEVRKWKELVNLKKEEKNDCQYLIELKEAVQKYQNFLYPMDYPTRMFLTAKMMKSNRIYGGRNACYVKLDCYDIKLIELRLFERFDEFIKWKNREENWIIYSDEIATYVNHETKKYQVVVIYPFFNKKAFLMNFYNPSYGLRLNVNGTTEITNDFKYNINRSFLLKMTR